jgi:glycine C-acetyltransferase
MPNGFYTRVEATLRDIESAGLTKRERVMLTPQSEMVTVQTDGGPRRAINFCANNYLGLANDPRVIEGAIAATHKWGAGLASVRFICGTQEIHKELEASIAAYLGYEDAPMFAAAFDANGGIFETLLGENDAVISDSLNHASIIDGVRLSKAKRFRFDNNDMSSLEQCLLTARSNGAETILIVTDGVFSMDGSFAKLEDMAKLAKEHDALIMVDDCHATGFVGPKGAGTGALFGVRDQIDIVTGTFGKALGGAMGGFVAARASVIALLRQRARPYLFSNALAPAICGASLAAIKIAQSEEGDMLRQKLTNNAVQFRAGLTELGFELLPGSHPIIPVMLHDAHKAVAMASHLIDAGIFTTPFSFPVVPHGKARIRTQISASHTPEHIDQAIAAFGIAGRATGVLS